MFNWQYDCTTVLIDTSSDVQDIDLVENEIKYADVVLLMYDISRLNTAQRLGIYWMPRIHRVSSKVPVVVVGNKSDLLEDEKLDDEIEFQRISKVIKPLVRHFNVICFFPLINSKSKWGKSIPDIIHCAQRAFLFPLAPLYDLNNKQLTIGFTKALTRIFRLCDRDQDGRWNDKELMGFQQRVFKRELDQGDITGIKEMIKEEVHTKPSINNQLQNNSNDTGITLEGFLALQKRGVELIKIQTCWTILRYFKYRDDLQLDSSLFNNEYASTYNIIFRLMLDREGGQSVELASKSIDFLKSIYKQYQRTDPLLPVSRIEKILFPSPTNPWEDVSHIVKTKQINQEDYIDIDNWIALWQYITFMDYMEAFKLIHYIGYIANLNDAFTITKFKKNSYSEYSKVPARSVFHVLLTVPSRSSVFAQNHGQTRALESLIDVQGERKQRHSPIVQVYHVQAKPKYVIVSLCSETELNHQMENKLLAEYEDIFVNIRIDFVIYQRQQRLIYIPFPSACLMQSGGGTGQSFISFVDQFNNEELKNQIIQMIEKPFRFMHSDLVAELKSQDSLLQSLGTPLLILFAFGSIGFGYFFIKRNKLKLR